MSPVSVHIPAQQVSKVFACHLCMQMQNQLREIRLEYRQVGEQILAQYPVVKKAPLLNCKIQGQVIFKIHEFKELLTACRHHLIFIFTC